MLVSLHTQAGPLQTLDDLLSAIRSASERFDQGRHVEVRSLAGHLSALLHGSDALIGRLNLGDAMTWVDTAGVPNPKTACSTAGLTLMRIRSRHHGAGEFVPKLAMYPPAPIRTRSGEQIFSGSRIPFEHWWTNPVVKDADGAQYSRKQLVLALGDATDAESAAARDALAGNPSLGWVVRGGADVDRPLSGSPVVASVRQIGYEVLQSITEQRDVIDARLHLPG
ncbi:hypothetical protein [Mycolicibacterium iranicum]|uniref:Uncharacterized protein n=1 Tax=Mycolicibacterium iranicum TaxID=912594 RepID=A0A178LWE4_MYCIR|nr:hypothetical protein [Mycolicibacterium iranicum]OAN38150.1 hypothetical protein A4X20_20125 [Mycolicibacterium iranicum]